MKAIESKRETEKKQKRNQWIIGGILIIVMLGSTFGYAFYHFGDKEDVDKVEYNGYVFLNQNDFWITNIGTYQFMFKYNPLQVEKTDAELNYLDSYSGVPLYIFSEDYVAEVEIYRNLGNVVQRFQGACLSEENCQENWPIKDCSNNFIIIRLSNESKISQDGACCPRGTGAGNVGFSTTCLWRASSRGS